MSDEYAVIGLGRSGAAVSRLLRRTGAQVYASDAGTGEQVRGIAAALVEEGIDAEAGRHDLERIARAAVLVASPGVAPTAAPLVRAREAGVTILSEIEVALRALGPAPYIAVTGTNGKTTVTALIAHLLRAVGREAVEAGNIGTPLSEVALAAPRPAWIVIELSSFQLHDTPSVRPAIAVMTNLAPDHLDRYAALDEYYDDKMRLFANAAGDSVRIVNADDAEVMRRTAGIPGIARTFSLADARADAWFDEPRGVLMLAGQPLMERGLLPLLGRHNVANALAAAAAAWFAPRAEQSAAMRAKLAVGLQSFRAMPHRLEPVGERDGVLWINDSKATNIGAARVALEGMTRPTVLLLGGRHKGEPYSAMLDGIRTHAKAVLAYGESAARIEADLSGALAGQVPLERLGSSFAQVIDRARAIARPGDAVLLAPACSSYDMFSNYEERGAAFRALALGEGPK